jgi:hypothetical protein
MSISIEAFEKAGGVFRIRLHEEYHAPDDDFEDPETLAWVKRQMALGNMWGWCCVEVIAELDDNFSGHDYLGGCSYESEEDFKNNGYYKSMQHEALADLERSLAAAAQHGQEAEARLKELAI